MDQHTQERSKQSGRPGLLSTLPCRRRNRRNLAQTRELRSVRYVRFGPLEAIDRVRRTNKRNDHPIRPGNQIRRSLDHNRRWTISPGDHIDAAAAIPIDRSEEIVRCRIKGDREKAAEQEDGESHATAAFRTRTRRLCDSSISCDKFLCRTASASERPHSFLAFSTPRTTAS